jgi:hypothetical protein
MSDADANATTQRALRKQLLLMRAATERAEMVVAVGAARQSAAFFQSGGVPGLTLAKGLPLVLGLLKRAPLVSSLLTLALSGARRPLLRLLRYGLLGAGSALLAWKGSQWLAGRLGQPAEPPPEQPADAGAPPA